MVTLDISNIKMFYDGADSFSCHRCGQAIRHIFQIADGTTYGSECIKHVVGLTPDEIERELYKEATREQREQRAKLTEAYNDQQEQLRDKYLPLNKYIIDFLLSYDEKQIQNSQGEWITIQSQGIAYNLSKHLQISSVNELSDKQFDIIWDMLDNQSVKYLKQLAKNKGITKVTGLNKDDLIEYILND